MVLIDRTFWANARGDRHPQNNQLRGLPKEAFAIPGVAIELVVGCRNQTDLPQIRRFLGAFNVDLAGCIGVRPSV
jgi:hypothetical protein